MTETKSSTTVKSSVERTVEVKAELAKQRDFLNLLGVTRSSTDDEIRKAYLKWVKVVHPDNLERSGIAHMKEQAALVFKALSEAYEILSNKEKKAAFFQGAESTGTGDGTDGASSSRSPSDEEARIAMHQSRLLLRRRAWAEAERLLRRYITFYPADPSGLLLLGWAVFQNPEAEEAARFQEAKGFWEKAVQLAPESADAHYYLSLYHKAVNDAHQQDRCLRKALKLSSSHVDAQREMRLLEMRMEKQKNRPESFKEFFARMWAQLNKKRGSAAEADGAGKAGGKKASGKPSPGGKAPPAAKKK